MAGYSGTEMIKWLVIVSVTFINENYTEISPSSYFYQVTQMSWHAVVLCDYNYRIIKSIMQYCWQMKMRLNVVYKMKTKTKNNDNCFLRFCLVLSRKIRKHSSRGFFCKPLVLLINIIALYSIFNYSYCRITTIYVASHLVCITW